MSTDESQTTTDNYRRVTCESQTAKTNHRRATDDYRRVRDEPQTTTDESQTSHGRLRGIIQKVFLNAFIKHYFQKGYGFQMPLWKGVFYLKEESLRFDDY